VLIKQKYQKFQTWKINIKYIKTRKNVIFDAIDYQIPVTQLRGVDGDGDMQPRLHILFAYNWLMIGPIWTIFGIQMNFNN